MSEQSKIVKSLKVVLISLACAFFMFFLHRSTNFVDIESTSRFSWLVIHYGATTAIVLWGFFTYIMLSWVYILFEKNMIGTTLQRALLFGGLTGSTWWIEMMELDQTLNNFVMGLVDAIMAVIVCIAIAIFVSPKRVGEMKKNHFEKKELFEATIVAVIFGITRLCFAVFLGKYFDGIGDYIVVPIYSVWMGVLWIKLKNMVGNGTDIRRAIKYSVIIWGIPSSVFMYFLAFLFANMFLFMTIRNIFDIIAMTIATFICLKIDSRVKNDI